MSGASVRTGRSRALPIALGFGGGGECSLSSLASISHVSTPGSAGLSRHEQKDPCAVA